MADLELSEKSVVTSMFFITVWFGISLRVNGLFTVIFLIQQVFEFVFVDDDDFAFLNINQVFRLKIADGADK